MATVELKSVIKIFDGKVTAVNKTDLYIKNNEFLVLVGPSGCGKSTLLRMIAGLEEVTSGEIHIDGKLVNYVSPKDRDIAMVFQNYALYPHMTVFDNMAFGLKLRKWSKKEIKKRVGETAEILHVEDFLDRKPKALSGGQRQRVALGRAIVRNPKVFLFDEPLSNLDAKLRVQMRAEIKKLHKHLRTTMIYVTHDQIEAMTMGSRIVILKEGVIQQEGSPLEVYKDPANLFVAGFIGSPAMNFIQGEIQSGRFVGCGLSLDLNQLAGIHGLEARKVVFGIRPENIHVDKYGTIDLSLLVTEPLGNETVLHLQAGEVIIITKVDSEDALHLGEIVKVNFNMNKCHLFDSLTQKKIL